MVVIEPSGQGRFQFRRLLAQGSARQGGQGWGRGVAGTSSRNIASADTLFTSLTTDASLTLASSSTFCRRFKTCVRSRTRFARCRVKSRSSRWGRGGTNSAGPDRAS